MNSYPSEFLAQLRPVMFIAGLDAPSSNSDTETSEDDRILGKRLQLDPFVSLMKRLKDVLQEKSIKKGTVWVGDEERAGTAFRIVLVDKNVRFPPRKAGSQDAHSPLSPLTQTSPLYPDGLIAPIWLRKHTELLPAVFVLFLRLFEANAALPRTPGNEKDEERRKEEEKRRDAELSVEIAARKRACSERGVKLTVVLMASRKMLDDPSLDSRLTFIKRQSTLDSRAALFVLSPVSSSELQDFVKSLQSALHDAALDYYLGHSKRVRRKRTKHANNVNSGTYGPTGHAIPPVVLQPLRPQGWLVRYEYKMACFAEFRGEEEVARKHYQTSWEILLDMFGSTAILPPRTKRWAEAKVLADCISVKIIKLYLYRAEHSRALGHFNAHLTRFADFSRGWGIGEETWEYWSWVARWYRILAEVVEMATLSNLVLPKNLPTYPIRPPTPPMSHQQTSQNPSLESSRSLGGVNPSSALQHPGFYYYAAAMCTERRFERFTVANMEIGNGSIATTLANERKVDHRVIILELYTKSYELFKKHTYGQGQSRLTFLIASRIAQTYCSSGKFDMAVRFFERIAKTYRREGWMSMLLPILSLWYGSTKQLGDVDTSVKLLIEMMGHGPPSDFEDGQLEGDLTAVLKSTSPSSSPFKLDLADSSPIFDSSVVFWHSDVGISEPAPFQLHLNAPKSVSLDVLPFVSLCLEFSDDRPSVSISHNPMLETTEPQGLQLIDLGAIPSTNSDDKGPFEASLRWATGGSLVIAGNIASDSAATLAISKVILTVVQDSWTIEMTLDPASPQALRSSPARWLTFLKPPTFLPILRDTPSTTTVRRRPHSVDVALRHSPPAYLDEDYPIIISITNTDDHGMRIVVDVLLQPAEDEAAVNYIRLGTEQSSGLIKGVQYGVLTPGQTVEKTLILGTKGPSGNRIIDVSVHCEQDEKLSDDNPKNEEGQTPTTPFFTDTSESLHTVSITTMPPFEAESLVTYRRPIGPGSGQHLGLADLRAYEPSAIEAQMEAVVRTTIVARGPWDVSIESITCTSTENTRIEFLGSTLDEEDVFPLNCCEGDVYSITSRFTIYSNIENVDNSAMHISPGAYQIVWSRVDESGTRQNSATSKISLPPLNHPSDGVDALLELPAIGRLHEPLSAVLMLRNKLSYRTADLHLQVEPSDHFVVSGLRSGNLPVLLAGSNEDMTFNLIPISCGTLQLPTIKLLDRRKTSSSNQQSEETDEPGERVDVLDARLEERNESGEEMRLVVLLREGGGGIAYRRVDTDSLTLTVLPY